MLSKHRYQWPTPSSLKQSLQLLTQILTSGSLSTFHYNTLIRAFNQHRTPLKSIHLLRQMHRSSVPFDPYTFKFFFKSCGQTSLVLQGKSAHGLSTKLLSGSDSKNANPLIQMYVELGFVDEARKVLVGIEGKDVVSWTTMINGLVKYGILVDEARKMFDQMPERNVVSWTCMIVGYSKAGRASEARELFKAMMIDGIVPDAAAMVSALSASVQLKDLEFGRYIHRLIGHKKILINENLASAIIDMYAKCGDIKSAHRLFDLMGSRVLPAWNALIDGYCKIGNVDVARSLFDQMETRDLITFNSMITGYIHSSQLNEALFLFAKLRSSGLRPDKFTTVGLLTACAGSGLLIHGKALHAYIELSAIEPDIFLGTALVDMYSKCGKMDQAVLVFNRMSRKDVQAWTAVISGFAMNGKGKLALEHFSSMVKHGIKPNSVAYIGVLNSCSHSGLIKEGRRHFQEMQSLYNIEPEIEHYGCIVDLLGRCGHLEEAERVITKMPMKPNAVIWGSLLNSCRVHKNIELAERVAERVLELEPELDAGHVQLYNVYMDSGRQFEASRIRISMEAKGIKKTAGFSSITIKGKTHKFVAGDRSHLETKEIADFMREMVKRLKAEGYSPRLSKVKLEMDEEDKEQALFGHSERMAIAFGIMKLENNLTINVVKNLRVCDDCHDVIKMISRIWSREIIVRDRSRFHHFWNGQCSCNDFW